MATFRFMCLVFLPFYMMSVQTAPRHTRSNEKNNPNILFLDENNNRNVDSLRDIQKQTNGLSPKTPLLENNKPTRATSMSNNRTPTNRFPYLDDMRQNWGILVNVTDSEEEDEESYKRPINIPKPTETPVKPIPTSFKERRAKPLSAAAPSPVLVSGNPNFTVTSGIKKNKIKPTSCDIALIVCCMRYSDIENCILANGCFRKVVPTNACQKNELNNILKKMKDYYS